MLLRKICLLVSIIVTNIMSAQTLSISSSGETGTSGSNWVSTWGYSPYRRIITATNTANINISVIQGYLNDGTSVEIRNIADPGRINLINPITKSAGGDATLTFRANGRVFVYNGDDIISTSGKLNVVLWSDYDNDGDGGVSLDGNLVTNGGHVWMGGSSSNGGSLLWNGLMVGNGPSRGGTGENANGMDIFANITTNNGDFLAWAGDRRPGSGGVDGIGSNGGGQTINTSSGDIILITDRVDGDGTTALMFETTGHFYLVPNDGAFKETFDWNGTVQSTYLDFWNGWNYMAIRRPENHNGLTIGRYAGMTTSQGIPVVQGNTSGVKVSKNIATDGPISVYGSELEIGANLTSSSGNGDIVLEGSTSIKAIDANRTLSSGTGDVRLTTDWLVHNTNPNYKLIVSSTGAFTFEPFGTAFSNYGGGLDLEGSLTSISKTYSGTGDATGLQINNTNNLTGLKFGKEGSSTGIVTYTDWGVNGPISMYGGFIDVNNNITATGGNILLDADLGTAIATGVDGINVADNVTIQTVTSGDITMIGRSGSGSVSNLIGYEDNANTIINSAGTLTITGIGMSSSGTGTRGVTLQGTYTAVGDITITGDDNLATVKDGITLTAVDITSTNGSISLNTPAVNSIYQFTTGINNLIAKNDINISTNKHYLTNVNFDTDGVVNILPATGSNSFEINIPIPAGFTFDAGITGLTVGNATNDKLITLSAPISIAGPVTVYGGNITLDTDLTTTNNGDISLYSDNPLGGLSTPRTLAAAGAFKYIPRGAAFTADVTYPITNLTATSTGLTIGNPTNDKNITINADVTGGSGIELYGNNLAINANLKTTNGAAMILKGNTTIAAGKYIESAGNFTHDGDITFKSDATGSAAFGPLGGTYTTTSGTVLVERYIPAKRAFRFLSPSVTTTSSIYENWQENGSSASGLGTHITGTGGAANGFDVTATNNPSMFGFDHATGQWAAVTSTNGVGDVLTAGTPYRLMVRGDRTLVLNTNTPTATPTTLRATGSLKTGDVTPTLNQSAQGYSFIGNPYQAPIDMGAVLDGATNMNTDVLYYWDPTLNTRGGYVTRTLSDNSNDVTSDFTEILQPGQAVFVKSSAANPTMTISETHKRVSQGTAGVFRNATTTTNVGLLRANLQANINNQWRTTDAALALFNDSYSWNVSQEDASKMNNLDEEVSFMQENTYLAIAKQNNASETDELPIRLQQLRHTNYRWVFDLNNYNGYTPYLFDTEQNTLSVIEDGTVLPFTAGSNTSNRFKIVFQNTTLNTPTFDNQISLYPNPSNGANGFYMTNITANAKVVLFTVLGQSVPVSKSLNGTTLQVKPMHEVAKGIYVVQVTSEDGATKQVKWIVE